MLEEGMFYLTVSRAPLCHLHAISDLAAHPPEFSYAGHWSMVRVWAVLARVGIDR